MAVARFVLFSAVLLLAGTVLFRRIVTGPQTSDRGFHHFRLLEHGAIAGAFAGLILWLPIEAAEIGNGWAGTFDPAILGGLLFDTFLGQVWAVQVLLVLAQAVLTICDRHIGPNAAVGGPLLLAFCMGTCGHGSGSGNVILPVLLGLHMVAAGVWVGSLPALWLSLLSAAPAENVVELSGTVDRFSVFARFAVVLAIATGLISLRLISGEWPTDLSSSYRQLILAKAILVAALIALALFNRFVATPKLASPGGSGLTMLRRTVGLDIAISTAVLALIAAIGTLSPKD